MYAAVFEMTGWLGVQQYVFEGGGPEQIMDLFQQIQDLDCLVMMGMQQERGAGKSNWRSWRNSWASSIAAS